MICYRDTTFCSDAEQCANKETCSRWLNKEERAKAIKWWSSEDVPVMFQSFKSTCDDFAEVKGQ